MATLRTDSPLCSRIVNAFIDFIKSVEPAPGVDTEGLEVATECLQDVFRLGTRSVDEKVEPNLLIDLFTAAGLDPYRGQESLHLCEAAQCQINQCVKDREGEAKNVKASGSVDEGLPAESRIQEAGTLSQDELFEQFREGLESAGFFANVPKGSPDYLQELDKARCVLQDTMQAMEKTGSASGTDYKVLAEAFKVQGNAAMSSKRYFEAIDLYTLAISLSGVNAVYYCNRAAAHTQVGKYIEAIEDSNKAIQLDPLYRKAYSRLGQVYYDQGKYHDAIQKGFMKALELDPNNTSVKENIRVANEKLDDLQKHEHGQSSGPGEQSTRSSANGIGTGIPGMGTEAHGPGFSSIPGLGTETRSAGFSSTPFNVPFVPPEVASMLPGFMNMATQFSQNAPDGHQDNSGNQDSESRNAGDQPEIRIGDINVSFEGGEMPDQMAGFMQSMLQMFSGAPGQQRTTQDGPSSDPPSS